MKKIICILLAMITLISLVACQPEAPDPIESSSESSSTPATESSEPEETEETDPPVSTLKIGGKDISDFVIVYPADNELGEKELAEKLAAHLNSAFEVEIVVVSDAESKAVDAIVVGDSSVYITSSMKNEVKKLDNYKVDTANATIVSVESFVWLAAANKYTIEGAVDKLIADATPTKAGDNIELDYSVDNAVCVPAESLGEVLKVMSYNVQTGTPTSEREKAMIKNITDFMPDVVGTQELNTTWINRFESTGLLEEYTLVGKPRGYEGDTSNGNEYSAILYRTSKFNLIDSGTYWLSQTPEKPNSKHPSSEYVRIMTFAVLERKSDGARFIHVNTHMEWDHGETLTNLIQTQIMLELVDTKIYSKHGELPTFFTGDFNVTMKSQGYKYIISTGKSDARAIAEVSSNENTFSGGSIIDYCIVSNDDFLVSVFDVGHGLPGSDHYPVYVQMYLVPQE